MTMILEICIIIAVILLLLLPVVFWGYISVVFSQEVNKRFIFLFWAILGAVSAVIFSWQSELFIWRNISLIFSSLFNSDIFSLSLQLGIFTALLFWVAIILQIVCYKNLYKVERLFFGVWLFAFLGMFLSILSLEVPNSIWNISPGLEFQWNIMASLGTISAFYVIIALLEELLKYFGVYASVLSEHQKTVSDYILLSISVALWFSLSENILYIYSYFVSQGIDTGMLSLAFFRGVFTMLLHIIACMAMSAAMWYILYKKRAIIVALIIMFASLFSHAFFDIALSYGMIWIIFIYAIWVYILLSLILPDSADR